MLVEVPNPYTFLGSSITDWIQAVAGIALFYTIYLQFKANKTQAKELQVTVLPQLHLVAKPIDSYYQPQTHNSGMITINVERNHCYNMIFKVEENTIQLRYEEQGISLSNGQNTTVHFSYKKNMIVDNIIPPFEFIIFFQDILGNSYSQKFKYFLEAFYPSTPVQLNKSYLES